MGTAKPQHRVPRIIAAPFVFVVGFLRACRVPAVAVGKGQGKEEEKRTGERVAFVNGQGDKAEERGGEGEVGARAQRRPSMVGEEREGWQLFKC